MAHIAFFGTPEFAVPALRALARFSKLRGHQISMVITQPDRAQGRGLKLSTPPVKALAESLGLVVLQPETLRKDTPDGDRFYEQFKEADIDLAVVVAYGKLIPKRLLALVKVNFLNIHASLLPRFRGAAPIQRALLAGDSKTGVCLMEVVAKLDEGAIFDCRETPLIASDTAATLFRRLSFLGAGLLYDRLDALIAGTLPKKAQSAEGVLYAPMIEKSEGALSFDAEASFIARKARAFDPWPSAYTRIGNKRVQLFDSFFLATSDSSKAPGTIVTIKPFLGIKAKDGIVYFQTMQIEGKKAMPITEATKGFEIAVGDVVAPCA